MREGPSATVIANGCSYGSLLSSWLGDTIAADDIPISSGVLTVDTAQQIPERLTFSVPDEVDGYSWVPDTADHPLNKNGQQIDVQLEVVSPVTQTDYQLRIGRFLIVDWEHDDVEQVVNVEALGLLQIAAEDSFITPETPRSGDTFVSAFTRLIGSLPVQFDDALVDRALPQSFQWDQDRLDALYDIADAWPARIRVDATGTVQVLAPLGDAVDVVATLTDGEGGTVISAPKGESRDGVFNVMVGRSSATDDSARSPLQVVVQVQGGPLDPDGDYGRAVGYYTSSLATTLDQLATATTQALKRSVLPALSKVVTTPPDPRFEVDDGLQIVQGNGPDDDVLDVTLGWVTGFKMPLTLDDGELELTIGSQVFT